MTTHREEVITMDHRIAKYAAAGAITGLLAIGGVSVASAQDSDDSTTTTVEEAPDASAPDAGSERPEDCPDKAADDAAASTEAS